MSGLEQYVLVAKSDLYDRADEVIEELRDYAGKNNLEPVWVMQMFATRLSYRINKIAEKE